MRGSGANASNMSNKMNTIEFLMPVLLLVDVLPTGRTAPIRRLPHGAMSH